MRGCTIRDNYIQDRWLIELWYLRNLIIEGNRFFDNIFEPTENTAGLIGYRGVGIGSIRDNTGSGNTADCIQIAPVFSIEVSVPHAHIQTSEEMPLISRFIHVSDSSTLEIHPGSVLKMVPGTHPAFEVDGILIADGAVFTSYEDDSHGGDTDLKPPGPDGIDSWGFNEGISIRTNGRMTMRHSTVQYAHGVGLRSHGQTHVDSSLFQYNRGSGIGCVGYGFGTHRITNSVFHQNEGSGIGFSSQDGLWQRLEIENCRMSLNSNGLVISSRSGGQAEVAVKRCHIAGNRNEGVMIHPGPNLTSLNILNCNISANGGNGIEAPDYDGDEVLLHVESSLLTGNRGSGISTMTCNHWLVNNTIAYNNTGVSLRYFDETRSGTANTIFCGNTHYGYIQSERREPYFGYNCFWDNNSEDYELYFRTDDSTYYTLEDLQALGGDYLTNVLTAPEYAAGVFGVIDTVMYIDSSGLSALVCAESPFTDRRLDGTVVQPDTTESVWYAVAGHTDDTLFVYGQCDSTVGGGDVCRVFDHHLLSASPLVDFGKSNYATVPGDMDNEDRIVDGDDDFIAVVDVGADEYDPNGGYDSPITVKSPATDDLVLANEVCVIEWESEDIDSVNVLYLANFDPAVPREWELVEVLVSADSGRIDWTVPRNLLSTLCKVRVEDAGDPQVYDESGLFKIKGYEMTRYAPDGSFEPFVVEEDGWGFPNDSASMWPDTMWQNYDYDGTDPYTGLDYPVYFTSPLFCNAQPSDFPDWPLWVDAFGVNSCYYDNPSGRFYRPSVVLRWSALKRNWKGSCFGLASASLLAFVDHLSFEDIPGIGPFDDLADLQISSPRRALNNRLWIYQFGAAFADHLDTAIHITATETLRKCQEMFARETASLGDRTLAFRDTSTVNGGGGHVVTPYRCEQDSVDGSLWRIFVYDNNYPMDNTVHFLIDTVANSWEYSPLGWKGRDEFFLADSVGRYKDDAILKTSSNFAKKVGGSDSKINAFIKDVGQVTFQSSLGAVGRMEDSVFCDVSGARPLVPFHVGESVLPLGFRLPNVDWRCEISGADTVVRVGFDAGSTILEYWRADVDSADTDELLYGCNESSLWVFSEDAERSYNVRAIMIGSTEERVVSIKEIFGSAHDSCLFDPGLGSEFLIRNFGEACSYDIELEIVGTTGSGKFAYDDMLLPANTTHQLTPDWENLAEEQLKILIDDGNDGSLDDSVFVNNIITDLEDEEYGNTLPYRFELAQNFPNPFNPMTTIEYSLPGRSLVRIDIYNVLGQKVRSLVDRELSAGSYTVTWNGTDASGNSVATGIYLYRFQSGNHVETKKMLLLK